MIFLKRNKWTFVYVLYVVICHFCNYAAGWLRMMSPSYQSFSGTAKILTHFALFFPLGLLWAAEAFFAEKADPKVVLTVRCVSVLVLIFLCLSLLVSIYNFAYIYGLERFCAMEAGLLTYRALTSVIRARKNKASV